MPVNEALDANMSALQQGTVTTAMDTAIATLTTVGDVHLSPEERASTPSIDEAREPFVQDCIENLAVNFPGLAGQEITVARATNNWNTAKRIKTIRAKLMELDDRLGDLEINAEYIAKTFMDDYYANCQRYQGRNVAGADSGFQRLNEYYSRFGTPGGTPPVTPP